MAAEPMRVTTRLWPGALVLLLPLVGLALLIARPEFDLHWEHHPSHFWIVLIAAAVNVVLAYVTNIAAGRYRDARLTLISLAFLASAGFLGLHALATPAVLLPEANIGFAIATPVGLIIASVFAAASATPLAGPRAMEVLRARTALLWGLIGFMALWAVGSIAQVPPLDGPPPPSEGSGVLDILSIVAVGLYAFAAVQLTRQFRYRDDPILLAMAAALVLLAEALVAMVVSRNWHFSWWEWHLLLLAAFATIALAAQNAYQRRGSLAGAFGGLYLDATLASVERWYASAVASVAAAESSGGSTDARPRPAAQRRRDRGGAGAPGPDRARGRPARRDLPPVPAVGRHGADPGAAPARHRPARNGSSRSCSPTCPASRRSASATQPREVVEMLNAYWAEVVPVIDRAGGTIEHFEGDGMLTLFNAAGDQPDHAARAVAVAREILQVTRRRRRARTPTGPCSGSGSTRVPRSSASSARMRGGASPPSATRSTRAPG